MRISTLPVLFVVLLFAQNATGGKKVDLGAEFKIKNGQQAVIRGEKLHITLASVNDSRCPTGVTCVWAGDGEISIEVAGKSKKQTVTLHTRLEPREIVFEGLKIRLVALNPYPRANETIDQNDHEATLIVTRDK